MEHLRAIDLNFFEYGAGSDGWQPSGLADGKVAKFTTQNIRGAFILLLTFLNNFVKFTSLQKGGMIKEACIINVLPQNMANINHLSSWEDCNETN